MVCHADAFGWAGIGKRNWLLVTFRLMRMWNDHSPHLTTLGSVANIGGVYRKIENFIRTKYESKRWVMDGGMPDPSTLDVGDDDVVSSRDMRWYGRLVNNVFLV